MLRSTCVDSKSIHQSNPGETISTNVKNVKLKLCFSQPCPTPRFKGVNNLTQFNNFPNPTFNYANSFIKIKNTNKRWINIFIYSYIRNVFYVMVVTLFTTFWRRVPTIKSGSSILPLLVYKERCVGMCLGIIYLYIILNTFFN